MKRRLFALPIVLGLVLSACGEEKDEAQVPPGDTVIPLTALAPQDATGGMSAGMFEEAIYKEYARLAARLPKRQNDSIIQAVMENPKDPAKIAEEMEKAMAPMLKRQDSIARNTLSTRYGISSDSVDAIIAIMKERTKNGGTKETAGGK